MSKSPMHNQFLHRLSIAAIAVIVFALLVCPSVADAQAPADTGMVADSVPPSPPPPGPASNVVAKDAPNDHGHALKVTWGLSADDGGGRNNVLSYTVLRTPRLEGPFTLEEHPPGGEYILFHSAVYEEAVWRVVEGQWDTLAPVPSLETTYEDRGGKRRNGSDFIPDEMAFQYKIITTAVDGGTSESLPSAPAQSSGQLIHKEKIGHIGIPVAVFTVLVLSFIRVAESGRKLYIRPLAGISAVDEAIGRATEMNRPILYVLGLGAADELATIASLTILSRVAKKVAEHRTELLVPCYDPVVMSIAQETVRQAYLDAGRPDEYKEDQVHYVTQEQFAYTAAVNGMMIRRKTATNFYLGVFFAESLILAETGSVAGSIQISGTDRVTQLPFFIVACDYTLIGEELYAASAYLGREPKLLGTLKAQDWAKAIFMIFMLAGIVGAALQWEWIVSMFQMSI